MKCLPKMSNYIIYFVSFNTTNFVKLKNESAVVCHEFVEVGFCDCVLNSSGRQAVERKLGL